MATVNSMGRVTARAVGTVVISVSAACCGTDSMTVNVVQEVAAVEVNPAILELSEGAYGSYRAVAVDANGHPIVEATPEWSIDDTSVAEVAVDGTVEALAPGQTIVSASFGGQTGSSTLIVAPEAGGPQERPQHHWPNAPTGWRTLIDTGFNYPNILPRHSGWFDIEGSNWAGRGEARLLQEDDSPVSPPHYISKLLPEGLNDGGGGTGIHWRTNFENASGGVYLAFTFRLSSNWHQNVSGMGTKYIEPYGAGPARPGTHRLGYVGWYRPTADTYRVKMDRDWNPDRAARGRRIAFLPGREGLADFVPGEWVEVEARMDFSQDGPWGGRARMWVNGELVIDSHDEFLEIDALMGLAFPNTFGGGIGSVPHDQWVDLGHIFVSSPR